VLAIAREFHGRSRVLLREEALEDSVKAANWTSCTHVVFSCHGTAGKRFNGLILSQQVPGAKENGFLMWQEAINCEFDADVMVLSACETGKGEVRRGEGVAGLVRAMMIAGSRAVVASLWSVNDPATAQLTARFFHKLIKEKKSKRTALREAKLELLRTQDYADPYYWAGFAIYGD
jgi:CHAT domain-containing protein